MKRDPLRLLSIGLIALAVGQVMLATAFIIHIVRG